MTLLVVPKSIPIAYVAICGSFRSSGNDSDRHVDSAYHMRSFLLRSRLRQPTATSPASAAGSHACGEPSDDGTAWIWSTGHGVRKQAATTVYPPVCSRGNCVKRLLHLDFSRGNDTRRFLLAAPCRQLALHGLPAVMH